jgi:hypothetical protein
MWRTPWPWSTAVLAIALILMTRRLSDAQVELERARAQTETNRAERNGAVRSIDGEPAWGAGSALDMSEEWEQAIPPMDS